GFIHGAVPAAPVVPAVPVLPPRPALVPALPVVPPRPAAPVVPPTPPPLVPAPPVGRSSTQTSPRHCQPLGHLSLGEHLVTPEVYVGSKHAGATSAGTASTAATQATPGRIRTFRGGAIRRRPGPRSAARAGRQFPGARVRAGWRRRGTSRCRSRLRRRPARSRRSRPFRPACRSSRGPGRTAG